MCVWGGGGGGGGEVCDYACVCVWGGGGRYVTMHVCGVCVFCR